MYSMTTGNQYESQSPCYPHPSCLPGPSGAIPLPSYSREVIVNNDDTSRSSCYSLVDGTAQDVSMEHGYNAVVRQGGLVYQGPSDTGMCSEDSNSSFACTTPRLHTPTQMQSPVQFHGPPGFSQYFSGSKHSSLTDDSGVYATTPLMQSLDLSAIRLQTPQSKGHLLDQFRGATLTPSQQNAIQTTPNVGGYYNGPHCPTIDSQQQMKVPFQQHFQTSESSLQKTHSTRKDYDCENQACIIEIRTHDVNDRENTLRVRHRITIAPGTAPDQLDKITTAAVEQVSRELRQEALVKIPQKGSQEATNETTIEVTRYPAPVAPSTVLSHYKEKSCPPPAGAMSTNGQYRHMREQTPPCLIPQASSTPAQKEFTPPSGFSQGLHPGSLDSDSGHFSGLAHYHSRRSSTDNYSHSFPSNDSAFHSSQGASLSDSSGHYSGYASGTSGYPCTPKNASSFLRHLSSRVLAESSSPSLRSPPELQPCHDLRTPESTCDGFDSRSQHEGHYPSKHTESRLSETTGTESSHVDDSLTNIQWLGKMSGDGLAPIPPPKKIVNNPEPPLVLCTRHLQKGADEMSRDKRPPYSYMHLIKMAISSSKSKRMTLKQIYKWVEDRFPFYKYSKKQGWKNSIRHNLSLYDTFIRQKSSKPGQSGCSYWTLRDDDMGVAFFSRPALMEVNSPEKQTKSDQPIPLLPKPSMDKPFTIIPIHNNTILSNNQNSVFAVTPILETDSKHGTSSRKRFITAHISKVEEPSPKRKPLKIAPKPACSNVVPVLQGLLNVDNISTYMTVTCNDGSTNTMQTPLKIAKVELCENIDSCAPGLPKPILYPSKESDLCKHQPSVSDTNLVKSETDTENSSSITSATKSLTLSPFSIVISTPPHTSSQGKIRLTSTPNKSDLCTPIRASTTNTTWISPIRTNVKSAVLTTPPGGTIFNPSAIIHLTPSRSKENSTSTRRSPTTGSLRDLGLPGLTPLKKTQTKLDMNSSAEASFTINNSSFARLLSDFHLDSIGDLNSEDIANISFSITDTS